VLSAEESFYSVASSSDRHAARSEYGTTVSAADASTSVNDDDNDADNGEEAEEESVDASVNDVGDDDDASNDTAAAVNASQTEDGM